MMEATSRVCGHLGQNFGSLIDSASGVRTRSHLILSHQLPIQVFCQATVHTRIFRQSIRTEEAFYE